MSGLLYHAEELSNKDSSLLQVCRMPKPMLSIARLTLLLDFQEGLFCSEYTSITEFLLLWDYVPKLGCGPESAYPLYFDIAASMVTQYS